MKTKPIKKIGYIEPNKPNKPNLKKKYIYIYICTNVLKASPDKPAVGPESSNLDLLSQSHNSEEKISISSVLLVILDGNSEHIAPNVKEMRPF